MPLSPAIPIDRSDVTVEAIEPLQCSECRAPATHRAVLDLRDCGLGVIVEPGLCLGDAEAFADRLRGSLPKPEGTGQSPPPSP